MNSTILDDEQDEYNNAFGIILIGGEFILGGIQTLFLVSSMK